MATSHVIKHDNVQKMTTSMSEEELSRLAREEILKEARSGSARAEQIGPQGWMKCPIPSTNKRFLTNTIVGTIKQPLQSSKIRHHSKKEDYKSKTCKTYKIYPEKTMSKSRLKKGITKNHKVESAHKVTKQKSSYIRTGDDFPKHRQADKQKLKKAI